MRVNKYDKDELNTEFKFHILKRSLKYLKPYRSKLIMTILISIFNGILFLFSPKIIQYAIDTIIPNKDIKALIIAGIILGIILIFNIIFNFIKSRILNRIKQSIGYDLKADIFIHLQYLPSTYYETRPHGKILTRATNYAETVAQSLCNDFLETILELINIVFIVIFMFTCHVPLTFIVLIFALAITIFFIKITPARRQKQHTLNNKSTNCNAYIAESINGITITQAYNREIKNKKIYGNLIKDFLKAIKDIMPYYSYSWSITDASSIIVNILIYLIGFFFFYPQTSLGTIIALGSYSGQFWNPISNITAIYSDIMDAITYLERIFELLDEPLVIENMEQATKLDIKGKVEFKDVTFAYIKNKNVLENINFEITEKQKVAFVGETGSGKSTIISLIARYYDVSGGNILIDDIPVKELELNDLRKQVNVMLQDNYVFSRTILENIKYGKKDVTKETVEKVCKEMQIHDWILGLKDGYDTILHNNGKDISTGQRQLICFARAIIANPKILILDEATSNVDLKTEKLVQEGLEKLLENRTSIVIAHRLSTIINCDKIFLLKDKKIHEAGTHKELMAQKGDYYKLYTAQL